MNNLTDYVEKVIEYVFLPATICGGLGGLFKCIRNGNASFSKKFSDIFGGIVLAHVASPVLRENLSVVYLNFSYLLVGWGGILFIELMYLIFVRVVEFQICRRFGLPSIMTASELARWYAMGGKKDEQDNGNSRNDS